MDHQVLAAPDHEGDILQLLVREGPCMQACVKAPLVDRLTSSCLPTGGVKFSYLLTGGVMSVSPDWRSLVLAPPDQLDPVIVGNDMPASTAQFPPA